MTTFKTLFEFMAQNICDLTNEGVYNSKSHYSGEFRPTSLLDGIQPSTLPRVNNCSHELHDVPPLFQPRFQPYPPLLLLPRTALLQS